MAHRRGFHPGTLFPLVLLGCVATAPTSPGAARLALVLRIGGEAPNGELGFRFGPPRDASGDGIADIAAGARFTELEFTQMGTVTVWSTDDGEELAHWEGHGQDALFGHAAVIGPDADGDGHPDVVASAPNGRYHGENRGILYARSVVTGRFLWSAIGEPDEGFGWDLALAGDQNADGTADIFVGSPGGETGKVHLISGRDGSTLRVYPSPDRHDLFGWYVSTLSDLDGDGLDDLLIGAPTAAPPGSSPVGAAHALSSASGKRLRVWHGRQADGMFGEVVAGLPDLDGDGAAEVAVGAPYRSSRPVEEWLPGEVSIFSGASGERLFHWIGGRGENYGRMVASAGDADGDGVGDIAIGAPWFRVGEMQRAGRFEVRSGRTGEVVALVEGDRPDLWLGWHIVSAPELGRRRQAGLVVSALRSPENDLTGAGALLVYVFGGG